jgi:hypothetical protein
MKRARAMWRCIQALPVHPFAKCLRQRPPHIEAKLLYIAVQLGDSNPDTLVTA